MAHKTSLAMDPRVAAIMARLENQGETRVKEKETEPLPDELKTLDDFMRLEGLDEWPQRLTSEGPLDIQSEGLLLGTQDDITELLREAAPLGLHMLEDLEDRLEVLEERLKHYADQIVTDEKRESRLEERLFHSPSRGDTDPAFMTEVAESDAVKSHHSSRGHKSVDLAESLMETRKKTLEYAQFPGFHHGELIELPGQLESPHILHRVTKAQDFNPGFKKFWKKLFLSEASVAVMQDTFWWFFLDKYDPKNEDKDLLYDRIADSFVALFSSTHKDVKDKFLAGYPECLAQAVFVAYYEAFSESRSSMDGQFKQDLVNLVHEWITGLRPVPGTWKKWKLKRLEKRSHRPGMVKESSDAAKQMMQAAALTKGVNISLDLESFEKMMEKLGVEPGQAGTTPPAVVRETTKTTNQNGTGTSGIAPANNVSQSRATSSSSRRKEESHQIGPGPEYERVKFNTQGRSPLISHYLYMRNLKDRHQPGRTVRRTEISKLPPPGTTYKQLIQNTLAMSDALSKEYQKICDQTNQEISELERKQRETNREINKLKKELFLTKNPLDLKILSERIMGLRERERETPLMSDRVTSQNEESEEEEET